MSKERRNRPVRPLIRRSTDTQTRGARDQVTQLYVGGLRPDVEKRSLYPVFEKFGRLEELWLAQNPPGFAFVRFYDHRDASQAVRNLDGQRMLGCTLRVEFSTTDVAFAPGGVRGGTRGRVGTLGRARMRRGVARPVGRGLRGRAPMRPVRRRGAGTRRGGIRDRSRNDDSEENQRRDREPSTERSDGDEYFEKKNRSHSRSPKPGPKVQQPLKIKGRVGGKIGTTESSTAVSAARAKLMRAKEVATRRKAGTGGVKLTRLINTAQRIGAGRGKKPPLMSAGETRPLPLMNVEVEPVRRLYARSPPPAASSQHKDPFPQPTNAASQPPYSGELRNRDGQRFGSKVVRRSEWNMPGALGASSSTANMSQPRSRSPPPPLPQRNRPPMNADGDNYGRDVGSDYGPRYPPGPDYNRNASDLRYGDKMSPPANGRGVNRSRSPIGRMAPYSQGPPARPWPYDSRPINDDRPEYGPRPRPYAGGDHDDYYDAPPYGGHVSRGGYGASRVSRAGMRGGRGRRDSYEESSMAPPYHRPGYASQGQGHGMPSRYPSDDRGWTPPPPPPAHGRIPPDRARPMSQYSSRPSYDSEQGSYKSSYGAYSSPPPRSHYMQPAPAGYPSAPSTGYRTDSQRGYASPARGERATHDSSQYSASYYSPPRTASYPSRSVSTGGERGSTHHSGNQYSSNQAARPSYDNKTSHSYSQRSPSPPREPTSFSQYMDQRVQSGKGKYTSEQEGSSARSDTRRRSRSYSPKRKVRERSNERHKATARPRRSPSPARSSGRQRSSTTSKYERERSRTPVKQRSRTPVRQNKAKKLSRSNSRSRNPKSASVSKRKASYSPQRYQSPVQSSKSKSKHKSSPTRYTSSGKHKRR